MNQCHSKWMKNLAFIVLLLPVVVYSQTIRKLDLPAGATDLIDPPQKRFQHLIEEGNVTTRKTTNHRDKTVFQIDYSFTGGDILAEVDKEELRIIHAYPNSFYTLYVPTIEGRRILELDTSILKAEELFNQHGPLLEDYKIDLSSGALIESEKPTEPITYNGFAWLGGYFEVTEPPPLSPFNW